MTLLQSARPLPRVGTEVAGALLVTAGDNPERLAHEAVLSQKLALLHGSV